MNDTPTPAPEPVNVPVEHVLAAYAEELAKAMQRALVAEATVTALSGQLASGAAQSSVESN